MTSRGRCGRVAPFLTIPAPHADAWGEHLTDGPEGGDVTARVAHPFAAVASPRRRSTVQEEAGATRGELGAMGDSPVIERAARHKADKHRRGQWLLIVGFLVLAAFIAGLAYRAWLEQAHAMTEQAERSLNAVAKLKATQISAWARERTGDAEVLSRDKLLSAAASDLLAGRDAAASAARIRSYLDEIRRNYHYVDVILVGPDGETLIRVPATATHALGARVHALVAEAKRTREVVSSDLYRGPGGEVRIELVAPVLAHGPATRRSPVWSCTSIRRASSSRSSRTGRGARARASGDRRSTASRRRRSSTCTRSRWTGALRDGLRPSSSRSSGTLRCRWRHREATGSRRSSRTSRSASTPRRLCGTARRPSGTYSTARCSACR